MAGRDGGGTRVSLGLVILVVLGACSERRAATPAVPVAPAAPQVQPAAPEPPAADPGSPAAPPAAASVPPSTAPVTPPPAKPSSVVVIDPGGNAGEGASDSLVEASRAERERRQGADRPVAVITDRNLAEFAKGQKLTIASPPAEEAKSGSPSAPPETPDPRDEAYWRGRARQLRADWHDAVERVKSLEGKTNELRTKFYATDDPYVRDGQIKPEWDRALAGLDEAKRAVERGATEVRKFLDEGRVAGALPGWLREGVELEPALPKKDDHDLPKAEPQEPQILEEKPPG